MGTALLADRHPVDILQFHLLLLIPALHLADQLTNILYHLLKIRPFTFPVRQRHPVVAFAEVPLDESPQVPLPLPLVLPTDILLCCLLLFCPLLSGSSIPSGMLLLDILTVGKLPCLPYIPPYTITTLVITLIRLIEPPRGRNGPKRKGLPPLP